MENMALLEQKVLIHSREQYPKEAVGLIENGEYYPCENIASDPIKTFLIAKDDWRFNASIVVHSHPNNEPYLSSADRIYQAKSGLEWWLVVSNKVKKFRYAPLLKGREFEYGSSDCCSIIEDVFMLMGVFDTVFKRTSEDEDIKKLWILTCMKQAGFIQISTQIDGLNLAKAGDVILTSIGGVANHASFYLGNEKVLHHPLGGLSRVENLGGIWHKAIHSVWRHPKFQSDMLEAVFNDLNAEG